MISRIFQKSSGGKKIPLSGIVRLGNFGNEIGSSGLPPLMDSSPFSSNKSSKPGLVQTTNVPCFSNPMDFLRNQEGVVDSINNNNPNFSNPTNIFPTIPLSNHLYSSTQTIPVSAANSQYPPSSVLMQQDQSILRALLENHGSNLRQSLKTEREMVSFSQETVRTSEMSTEISSVVSNLEVLPEATWWG